MRQCGSECSICQAPPDSTGGAGQVQKSKRSLQQLSLKQRTKAHTCRCSDVEALAESQVVAAGAFAAEQGPVADTDAADVGCTAAEGGYTVAGDGTAVNGDVEKSGVVAEQAQVP